jgi:hypothetical protein
MTTDSPLEKLIEHVQNLSPLMQQEILDFAMRLSQKKERKHLLPSHEAFGSMQGMIKLSNDFDEPLSDFKDYMPE